MYGLMRQSVRHGGGHMAGLFAQFRHRFLYFQRAAARTGFPAMWVPTCRGLCLETDGPAQVGTLGWNCRKVVVRHRKSDAVPAVGSQSCPRYVPLPDALSHNSILGRNSWTDGRRPILGQIRIPSMDGIPKAESAHGRNSSVHGRNRFRPDGIIPPMDGRIFLRTELFRPKTATDGRTVFCPPPCHSADMN